MWNAIKDSLSDHANSNNEEDGEDEEDDEPGGVMGTISKTVEHCMESVRLKQKRLDEVTQPWWGDAAKSFRERDMKYGTAELNVQAVVKPQIDMTAGTPSPPTCGELRQTLDIVHGQSQMVAVTSRPSSSEIRLGSEKPQRHKFIPVLLPDAAPSSTPIQDVKPVDPASYYPWVQYP